MAWNWLKLPKLSVVRFSRPNWSKAGLATLVAGAVFGAFYLGRQGGINEVCGQAPQTPAIDPQTLYRPTSTHPTGNHVVAYIYNNVPITREELGEYLIERFGADHLEFLINRRIIEMACAAKNIRITDQEVAAQLALDIKSFQCTEHEFVAKILKPHNKTLLEWKEDVIRPKLAMERYVEKSIAVTEDEIKNGFEAKFGPQVQCRWIVLHENQMPKMTEIWGRVHNDGAEFEREAKNSVFGPLAANAGMLPPIHQHFAEPNLEREAFKLKPGEVSPLIALEDKTTVILRCEKLIDPDTTKKLDNVRMQLYHEIFEAKVKDSVKAAFPKMREEAKPQIFLQRDVPPQATAAAQGGTAPMMQPQVPPGTTRTLSPTGN
jgi:foldase protein PrsA